MKIYITNYSNTLLSSEKKESIYVHYNSKCKRLNMDYIEEEECIPNSGIIEKNFEDKEKLFSTLTNLGKFILCKECQQTEFVKSYDEHLSEQKRELEFINEAIIEYDKLIKSGKL